MLQVTFSNYSFFFPRPEGALFDVCGLSAASEGRQGRGDAGKRSHKINVLSVGTFVGSDGLSHAKQFNVLSKLLGGVSNAYKYTPPNRYSTNLFDSIRVDI